MACNLILTHDGDPKILNLTDDRLGHLRIVRRDRIDEWIKDYVKWHRNGVEEQETEGSGFVYHGWIGFHVEMFPLRTYVGYKHPTPFVIGRQWETRIPMTTDVCNGVSSWQVKVGTRLLQIARWVMQVYTTSDGSNPISTRYSE